MNSSLEERLVEYELGGALGIFKALVAAASVTGSSKQQEPFVIEIL